MKRCVELFLGLVYASLWTESFCGPLSLTILHTNDVHARFDEANAHGGICTESDAKAGQCYGGMARLKTKVDEIRARENNTLFVNAGDYYQGTLYFVEFSYNITAHFNNLLEYDAVSLGNHEFDLGVEGLVPYLDQVNFPVLACNLDVRKEPRLRDKVACEHIFTLDGERVALIGFVTPDTKDLSKPGNVEFLDEAESLQTAVNSLVERGVNKIIAVGHSGYGKDKEIAGKVKGLDVVVGGHTNTFLYKGDPPTTDEVVVGEYPTVIKQADGSEVLVVQAHAYAKYLGYLKVQFDEQGKVSSWKGNPILLNSTVKMDPEVADALKPYKEVVESKGAEVVGRTHVLLRGDRGHCRLMECNMGNLVADASVNYFARPPTEEGWVKQTIAIYMSGGIRASIDEKQNHGNITWGDLKTVFPFGNDADLAHLYGRDLREAMEWSVRNYDTENPPGAFLQVSGLQVVYDLSRDPGQRVVELKALCAKCRVPRYFDVEDEKVYAVVLPSFLLQGGDGFTVIKEKAFNISNTGALDVQILQEEIRRSSPLTKSEERRIIFVDSTYSKCSASSVLVAQCLLFVSLVPLLRLIVK